jgi:hypothetical protein
VVPASVAPNVGTTPDTKLFPASLRVIVIVEEAVPSATIGPVPVIEEFKATGDPATKVTVVPTFTTGVRIESVLTSAFVELRVHVEIPEASELEHAP